MSDEVFRSVLSEDLWVCRPSTRLAADLTVATPTYRAVGGMRRARVVPVSAEVHVTVLGRTPGETRVVYMEPGDIGVGDRLEVIGTRLGLAGIARPGDAIVIVADASGVVPGARIHLHCGVQAESVAVVAVTDGALAVAPSLRYAHGAGEDTWVTRAFDVEGVSDEAGQGHHLKVLVRAIG